MNGLMLLMSEENRSAVLGSLDIMWKGVLAIFIVIGIIAIVTFIMNDIAAQNAKAGGFLNRIKKFFAEKFPKSKKPADKE
ncbi:MAG TPA: hypothetical protein IAB05_01655 [Candidatus Stercoripulliclostridium merdigallinarum]|uniref:Uncharacterized protein n=1 Tax=Candidatus Stercoripulliclostridium merdigallinarum TaxID=2840951 RepID=A0A9D1MGW5_9FIRM|nr:hypothetical protein [Candidatus Stercoripulliclostridium merdigallinarum]